MMEFKKVTNHKGLFSYFPSTGEARRGVSQKISKPSGVSLTKNKISVLYHKITCVFIII